MGTLNVQGLHLNESPEGIFPLVVENLTENPPIADAKKWISDNLETIKGRLSSSGAILFRGFGLTTDQDFDAFISWFNYRTFTYEESLSNAVRVNRTPRVFTANEAPPSEGIFLHNEMAQTPIYPTRLFFFCEQAAETQGETSLCPCDKLYDRLLAIDPDFIRDCEEKGVKYTNIMPNGDNPLSGQGRGWQTTLNAPTKAEAEERLRELGYELQI